ncbi:uncharacterized protein BDZ99DRAFT_575091 [Mytilinidion resinicola]|uniref:Cora-domain-containing protein n=1 Tax=Mytilinidion resinicola TaxID=574789 RepID=A0A6A6Y8M1_9PEZI|nr:uncharacterized protein BDZ99DRAFT_575091 [Mytilinidion resinicola]KAF2804898.1 hypothetical protein BDZ99DRAFT_575091 [Mytilinidion resinicola]
MDKFLREPTTTTSCRTIVVEGLSKTAIRILGDVYGLDPEVFLQHSAGRPHFDQETPTSDMNQTTTSCVTLQWSAAGHIDIKSLILALNFGLVKPVFPQELENLAGRAAFISHGPDPSGVIIPDSSTAILCPFGMSSSSGVAALEKRLTLHFVGTSRLRPYHTTLILCDPAPVCYADEGRMRTLFSGLPRQRASAHNAALRPNGDGRGLKLHRYSEIDGTELSTAATAWRYLGKALPSPQSKIAPKARILSCVLQTICQDHAALLNSLINELSSLRAQLPDEQHILSSLKYLQWALLQHDALLHDMERSLSQLRVLWSNTRLQMEDSTRLHPYKCAWKIPNTRRTATDGLEEQIVDLLERHYGTRAKKLEMFNTLATTVSIIESERQIQEATSVTKLTELAFVFIPLSFSASLYSMQVKELQNGVSLWIFVTTAILILVLSYTSRLTLRS